MDGRTDRQTDQSTTCRFVRQFAFVNARGDGPDANSTPGTTPTQPQIHPTPKYRAPHREGWSRGYAIVSAPQVVADYIRAVVYDSGPYL